MNRIAVAEETPKSGGLPTINRRSLEMLWTDTLGPIVSLEHFRDVRQGENVDMYELDANGDSQDGRVVKYHAVSLCMCSALQLLASTSLYTIMTGAVH